jgi:hypothetical protein
MGVIALDPLEQFCFDLMPPRSRESRQRSSDYAGETLRALEIVARRHAPTGRYMRKKSNPVWVDADGAERVAAMREAITAWTQGNVAPTLCGQRLLGLAWDAVMEGVNVRALSVWSADMQARCPHAYGIDELDDDQELAATHQRHMKEREEWLRANLAYQRLAAVLRALHRAHDASTPAVFYVDYIHRLLGGGGQDCPFDLFSVLKPLLHRCQVQLWGACALAEYRATIEQDASMWTCFQAVMLTSAGESYCGWHSS